MTLKMTTSGNFNRCSLLKSRALKRTSMRLRLPIRRSFRIVRK